MSPPPPLLSIVIVTHLHRSYIERCLASVAEVRGELPMEVLLVDNRSEDGTVEAVASRFPWVQLYQRDRRYGFSENNNFGIQRASGQYFLILNPDTEVLPGAMRTLYEYMETHPEAGICGAKLLFPDGFVQPSCRRFPTLSSSIVRRTPLRWFLKNSEANSRHLMLDMTGDLPREVDWLLGACLFVRRKAIEQVGLLDEGYFLYVEDIDWCYRMRQKGWKVSWVPQAAIVHHHLAVSDRKLLGWHSWVHMKSMVRYYRKHLAPEFLRIRAGRGSTLSSPPTCGSRRAP